MRVLLRTFHIRPKCEYSCTTKNIYLHVRPECQYILRRTFTFVSGLNASKDFYCEEQLPPC